MKPSPAIDTAPITDVTTSTWAYLKHQKPLAFYSFTAIAILASLTGLFVLPSPNLIVLPVALYASWIYRIRLRVEAQFLQQFARRNALDYHPEALPLVVSGRVLTNGRDPHATSVISGSLGALPYQLFLYTTTVGEGRNQSKFRNTVMEVSLGKNAPNLYAISLKHTRTQSWWQRLFQPPLPETDTTYSLRLEGNFDQ